MSLPPGFLDELRNRTSLSEVVGRKVVWDTRKSNPSKGDMWAPCPFHQEKTASFHVDDRKGYYYCFGCHEKGDAISFLRDTDNMSFMEAVQTLATMSGLEMPAQDPRAKEKRDRRAELTDVMEMAVRHFRLNLAGGAGAAARDYLAGRALTGPALERWDIGFAKDGWQGLWDHLRDQGVAEDLILECGLARPSSKGGKPYDTFRNRIMYPIRDAQGRCIAFGGRAMDPGDTAKYINSPDTLLFDKGRSLYNHGPARSAAGKDGPLIVAEGYMDVIALSEAGFACTVAPLGTAITEDQLRLMWRMADEPIIALDGDKAGLRAAMRLIDLALPMLEPGRSLRFCVLPQGQDPDDLLKAGGAAAMSALLDKATPLVEMLWQRELEGRNLDSPERRAALDRDLRFAVAKIQDASLKGHYNDALRARRDTLFGKNKPQRGFADARSTPWRGKGQPVSRAATAAARASALAAGAGQSTDELREAVILASCLYHPTQIDEHAAALEEIDFIGPGHAAIAAALLDSRTQDPEALRAELSARLGAGALESLLARPHVATAPPVMNPSNSEIARLCVAEEVAKLSASRGVAQEVADATEALSGEADEWVTWRLGQAAEAQHKAHSSQDGDKAEFDIAPNGVRLDRDERAAMDRLFDQIQFAKSDKYKP